MVRDAETVLRFLLRAAGEFSMTEGKPILEREWGTPPLAKEGQG